MNSGDSPDLLGDETWIPLRKHQEETIEARNIESFICECGEHHTRLFGRLSDHALAFVRGFLASQGENLTAITIITKHFTEQRKLFEPLRDYEAVTFLIQQYGKHDQFVTLMISDKSLD